jgi:hypothetical protein
MRRKTMDATMFLFAMALATSALFSCASPRDGESEPLVIRESAEAVLRGAWSIARVRVENQTEEEAYGFFSRQSCGVRALVTVLESLKGPSEPMVLLSWEPLDPGHEYLIASRRIDSPLAEESGQREDCDTEAFLRCRYRHPIHAVRSAPFHRLDGEPVVLDPRGAIIPPGRHPEWADRPPVPWAKARETVAKVLDLPSECHLGPPDSSIYCLDYDRCVETESVHCIESGTCFDEAGVTPCGS